MSKEEIQKAIGAVVNSDKTATEEEGLLISVAECAKLLKIGRATIYRSIITDKDLPTETIGNIKYIRIIDKNLCELIIGMRRAKAERATTKKTKYPTKYSYKINIELSPNENIIEILNAINDKLNANLREADLEDACKKYADAKKMQFVIPIKTNKDNYKIIRDTAKKYNLTAKEVLHAVAQEIKLKRRAPNEQH